MSDGYHAPDEGAEHAFWWFVHCRQEAFYNRHVLKLPRERWTDDAVISNARFTNAYRELDRGTKFGVEGVLEVAKESVLHDVAHSITYRWFNRIETYQDISALVSPAVDGEVAAFECMAHLLDERLDSKQKVFTGAYMCSYARDFDHPTKGWNYAEGLLHIYAALPAFVDLMLSPRGNVRALYNTLAEIPGFGPFLAYQCVLDLMYPLARLRGAKVAPWADVNEWTQPGPGCTKGLALLGVRGPDATQVRAMRALHAKHVYVLSGYGFKWIRMRHGDALQLSLGNIENCFCEFSKYMRMLGGGHVKTRWSEPEPNRWESSHITLPYYGAWCEPENGRTVHV